MVVPEPSASVIPGQPLLGHVGTLRPREGCSKRGPQTQDSCSCRVPLLPPPLMGHSSDLPAQLLKWQLWRQCEVKGTWGTPRPAPLIGLQPWNTRQSTICPAK